METGLRAQISTIDEATDIKLNRQELLERFDEVLSMNQGRLEKVI